MLAEKPGGATAAAVAELLNPGGADDALPVTRACVMKPGGGAAAAVAAAFLTAPFVTAGVDSSPGGSLSVVFVGSASELPRAGKSLKSMTGAAAVDDV